MDPVWKEPFKVEKIKEQNFTVEYFDEMEVYRLVSCKKVRKIDSFTVEVRCGVPQ